MLQRFNDSISGARIILVCNYVNFGLVVLICNSCWSDVIMLKKYNFKGRRRRVHKAPHILLLDITCRWLNVPLGKCPEETGCLSEPVWMWMRWEKKIMPPGIELYCPVYWYWLYLMVRSNTDTVLKDLILWMEYRDLCVTCRNMPVERVKFYWMG
jgi:hypothetical protein